MSKLNAIVEVNTKDKEYVFCSYCGQKFNLVDENSHTFTYNINKTNQKYTLNVADVIRAENSDKESKRNFILILVLVLISLIVPIVGIIHSTILENRFIAEGKVSVGSSDELIGEDYKTVEAHFESAGFTNIETIDLNDSGILVWKNNKVETISIAGKTSFSSEDYFDPDSKVVISYH